MQFGWESAFKEQPTAGTWGVLGREVVPNHTRPVEHAQAVFMFILTDELGGGRWYEACATKRIMATVAELLHSGDGEAGFEESSVTPERSSVRIMHDAETSCCDVQHDDRRRAVHVVQHAYARKVQRPISWRRPLISESTYAASLGLTYSQAVRGGH